MTNQVIYAGHVLKVEFKKDANFNYWVYFKSQMICGFTKEQLGSLCAEFAKLQIGLHVEGRKDV